MNRTMKKIISVITMLSMYAAIIGVIPVLATNSVSNGGSGARDDPYLISTAEDEGEATIRNLYVDFMGVGDSPGAGKKSGNLNSTNINNTFWVGVAVDKVNDLNLFTEGIYSLELAFEYDPNFVRPDIKDSSGSTTGTDIEKDDRWNAKIAGVNIGSETDKIWNSNYTSIAVYDTDIDPNTDRANKDLLTERQNWKMCTVSITLTEQDVENLSFKGLSSPDKQYLLKLPFTLVGAPAEGSADPNPIVLSLIRGPETFDIGSGSNGEFPNAKWNETENQGALNNLKTYFSFAGDVRLFGESTSIEDITPFRMVPKLDDDGNQIEENGEIVKVEEEYKLSYDNTLSEEDFNPEVDTYYLSISNDPNNLQLRIKTDSQPYIYLNGSTTPIVTSSVTGGFVTAEIPLRELDVSTKDQDNGFNNTISIRDDPSATDSLYTIYVRRLLKPKIELNYGNSPYGEIMKTEWSTEDKIKAKEAFDKDNKYGENDNGTLLIPPQAIDKTQQYDRRAWIDTAATNIADITVEELEKLKDPNVNIDRNETAIFIYNGEPFVDPGFKATNSLGDSITIVDRTITVQRIKSRGSWDVIADSALQGAETIDILGQPSNALITDVTREIVTELINGKIVEKQETLPIRPDIYEMIYSFNDTNEGLVEIKRKVVVLQPEGDGNFSFTFNDNDFIPINAWMLNRSQFSDKIISDTARRIYVFKTLDLNGSETVNDNDYIPINAFMLNSSNFIPSPYVKLPSSL